MLGSNRWQRLPAWVWPTEALGGRAAAQPAEPVVRCRGQRDSWLGWLIAALIVVAIGLNVGWAQERRRLKVPVLGKIAGGSTRSAFSGKLQSVDRQRNLIHISTVEGGGTEIFQIKKDVRVSAADGTELKISDLSGGLNVIVYFEKKGDRRRAKDIVVLGAAPAEEEKEAKKSPSPS